RAVRTWTPSSKKGDPPAPGEPAKSPPTQSVRSSPATRTGMLPPPAPRPTASRPPPPPESARPAEPSDPARRGEPAASPPTERTVDALLERLRARRAERD